MGFLPPHSNHWDDGTPEYHNNISCSCRKKFTPSSKLLMTKGPWNPRIWIWLCKFWRIMTLIVSFSTNYNSKSHYYIRLMTCVQWPMTDLHTVIVRGGELAHWWFNGLLMGGFCVQSLPGCISKGLCLIVASIIFTSLLYCWCGNDVKLLSFILLSLVSTDKEGGQESALYVWIKTNPTVTVVLNRRWLIMS